MDTVIGLAFMLAGCAMVAFRRRAGEAIIKSQNQTWGFKFGKREERYSGLVVLIVGAGWAVIGFLALVDVIHFKN